jgi:hypothetical protein
VAFYLAAREVGQPLDLLLSAECFFSIAKKQRFLAALFPDLLIVPQVYKKPLLFSMGGFLLS